MHEYFMKLALKLAAGVKGQTGPNPMVGAVVVKNGEIVGIGAHLHAGGPHAEVHALQMAGAKAEGSTVYVTLEPCTHHGRTPPCCDALIHHKVHRVVIATLDPNPKIAGNGIRRLKEAGIEVLTGVCEREARKLNEVYNKYITTGLPFITLKIATTLDGKVATHTGSSRWITGEDSRREAHQLRHQHDAILVGVNTVIADDPQLTTRLPLGGRNPLRIIIDSTLRIPIEAKVVQDQKAPTWIFTTDRASPEKKQKLESLGVKVFTTGNEHRVNIQRMLEILGENEIASVLVEGGSQINSAFLHARCIDKVVCYIAPKIVAGQEAPSSFGGKGIDEMSKAVILSDISVERVGEDIRIIGYPTWRD